MHKLIDVPGRYQAQVIYRMKKIVLGLFIVYPQPTYCALPLLLISSNFFRKFLQSPASLPLHMSLFCIFLREVPHIPETSSSTLLFPVVNYPSRKQTLPRIMIRNRRRLHHDYLRRHAKHQKRFDMHAVETAAQLIQPFCKRDVPTLCHEQCILSSISRKMQYMHHESLHTTSMACSVQSLALLLGRRAEISSTKKQLELTLSLSSTMSESRTTRWSQYTSTCNVSSSCKKWSPFEDLGTCGIWQLHTRKCHWRSTFGGIQQHLCALPKL